MLCELCEKHCVLCGLFSRKETPQNTQRAAGFGLLLICDGQEIFF